MPRWFASFSGCSAVPLYMMPDSHTACQRWHTCRGCNFRIAGLDRRYAPPFFMPAWRAMAGHAGSGCHGFVPFLPDDCCPRYCLSAAHGSWLPTTGGGGSAQLPAPLCRSTGMPFAWSRCTTRRLALPWMDLDSVLPYATIATVFYIATHDMPLPCLIRNVTCLGCTVFPLRTR